MRAATESFSRQPNQPAGRAAKADTWVSSADRSSLESVIGFVAAPDGLLPNRLLEEGEISAASCTELLADLLGGLASGLTDGRGMTLGSYPAGSDALDEAHDYFRERLAAVRVSHLELPTPCAGWDVRDLLNHILGGQRRYLMLLNGASTAEVEATRQDDHLGGDALASFDTAHAELKRAFAAPGALERTVHHRSGDRSGRELLLMRTLEYAVHGWDLAQAIGFDGTMDTSLASFLASAVTASRHLFEGPRRAFAEAVPVTLPAAAPQVRLLALTGRSARQAAGPE